MSFEEEISRAIDDVNNPVWQRGYDEGVKQYKQRVRKALIAHSGVNHKSQEAATAVSEYRVKLLKEVCGE